MIQVGHSSGKWEDLRRKNGVNTLLLIILYYHEERDTWLDERGIREIKASRVRRLVTCPEHEAWGP